MRFEYDITTFPTETAGYNLVAYTEGTLRVYVKSALFLDASEILLVELAIALHKWTRACASAPTDFYYASMDYEEEPILAFQYDAENDQFSLDSVWSRIEAATASRERVNAAVKQYMSQLSDELRSKHGVDLEKRVAESIKGE